MPRIPRKHLAAALERLYASHNRRDWVDPDPLACVYRYNMPRDLEIAGLIAATLAYGRVAQIMRNVNAVFDTMGTSPHQWITERTPDDIRNAFHGFQHRWTTAAELAELLVGIQRAIHAFGTLENAFLHHQSDDDDTTLPALTGFCAELRADNARSSLISDPAKNAACKRLHLYLRWMVRCDDVDPGCWTRVSPARLVIPLDTHMHQIARRLGLTRRAQANLATALDITAAFRALRPEDPARYDFVLTRFGIRTELTLSELYAALAPVQ